MNCVAVVSVFVPTRLDLPQHSPSCHTLLAKRDPNIAPRCINPNLKVWNIYKIGFVNSGWEVLILCGYDNVILWPFTTCFTISRFSQSWSETPPSLNDPQFLEASHIWVKLSWKWIRVPRRGIWGWKHPCWVWLLIWYHVNYSQSWWGQVANFEHCWTIKRRVVHSVFALSLLSPHYFSLLTFLGFLSWCTSSWSPSTICEKKHVIVQ